MSSVTTSVPSHASTPPAAIANFRFAKLRDLVISHKNWLNPRTITGLDAESIVDLSKDIKKRKIQRALIVQKIFATPDKNPEKILNLVLDGQRRYLAAEEVLDEDDEIPVIDRTAHPIELTPEAADVIMLDVLSSFARTEGLSSYELSEVAQRLRERGKTLADIGSAIKRDESWVSKILTARKNADPKLMIRWRKGEITEEQFKELAAIKDPEKQLDAAKEVVKAREGGDAAEARIRAKELAAQYKQEQKGDKPDKAPAVNGANGAPKPRAVTGPQEYLFDRKPPAPSTKIVIKPSVLEDMIAMADKRPPTADYVKGVIDMARFLTGEIEMADLRKPWHAFVSRVSGTAKPKKAKGKKSTKAKKSTKGKAAQGKRK